MTSLEIMERARVVPVIRTRAEATARRAVDVLARAGFSIFELTMTTPGAISIVADLAGDPDRLVGAGTVMTAAEAEDCIDAGARFIVSPAVRREVADVCRARKVEVFLGAATPTEVATAHELGAAAVKLFPAAQLGGPGFVRAVKSVFPGIAFMPTGGIGIGDIAAYLDAGAACVGMGGRLVDERALAAGDDAAILAAARDIRAVLEDRA
jgi:2-dehydro-3-deoxyphosphogluconate aldolase / (4S)-4-hydroxy-2-oxoglutarate aldolase